MKLNIHTSKSPEEAKQYFTNKQSPESYYTTNGQEFAGNWGGHAAAMLGLNGPVTDEAFGRLCDNLHPITGKKLTVRMKDNRRPGFDCNFNVPKSVSLLYAWSKDERLVWAFRQACWDTLMEMQEAAATRVRIGGKDEDRKTGALCWAEIIHLTARPENGVPDPHLHSHCYVFNVTWDTEEQRFKALQMGNIKDQAAEYERKATVRLAANLKSLGLEIEWTVDAFEIVGINRALIEKFSRRTKTIEQEAAKRGITDPKEKAKLATFTRERKEKHVPISEYEPIWWGGLKPEEKKALTGLQTLLQRSRAREVSEPMQGKTHSSVNPDGLAPADEAWLRKPSKSERISLNQATQPRPLDPTPVEPTDWDRRAVKFAMAHLFERQSVVTQLQLEAEATWHWCFGKTSLEGIRKVIETEAKVLRKEKDLKVFLTTPEVLAQEERIADQCFAGRLRFGPINPEWTFQDNRLNTQQRQAVRHVLESRDFITGISGKPGTGKTTLLRELRRGVESSGSKLFVFAPTSEAAREVLRREGFPEAETVARLLASAKLQEAARGATLLIDEAGLLSAPTMERLIAVAQRIDARLVLVGDPDQHHSVERGQAFELLQKAGGMSVMEISEIQRQTGYYKEFVEKLVRGDVRVAFDVLMDQGDIKELPLLERHEALVQDYLAVVAQGKTALIVTPTHAERESITESLRAAFKAQGLLKPGVEWDTLDNLSWTNAQKCDYEHYRPGLVVQFNYPESGFARGEQATVVEIRGEVVRLRGQNGRVKALPLACPESFNVYEPKPLEICRGEEIRITQNGKTADGHELNNGKHYKVSSVGFDGNLVLENGWKIDRNFKHLEYGYTSTSHGAQGKTVDVVLVAQRAEFSSRASDLKQFLVSTTRGREAVKIYPDDIELLLENVSRRRDRMMAMELFSEDTREKEETRGMGSSKWLGQCPKLPQPQREQERSAEHLGQRGTETISQGLGERMEQVANREREMDMEISL